MNLEEIQTPVPTQPTSSSDYDEVFPQWPPDSLETLLHPTDEAWRISAFRPPLGQREFPYDEPETTSLGGGLPYSRVAVPVTATQATEAWPVITKMCRALTRAPILHSLATQSHQQDIVNLAISCRAVFHALNSRFKEGFMKGVRAWTCKGNSSTFQCNCCGGQICEVCDVIQGLDMICYMLTGI